jgi:hypothetical protein
MIEPTGAAVTQAKRPQQTTQRRSRIEKRFVGEFAAEGILRLRGSSALIIAQHRTT